MLYYTLYGVGAADIHYWIYEKRGTCKARITTPQGCAIQSHLPNQKCCMM